MSQADIEDAIVAWIAAGSGLAADRIRWSGQGGVEPTSGAWISLTILDDGAVGQDWTEASNNPSPTTGDEVILTTRGSRSGVLSVQCYGGDPRGNASAMQILRNVVLAASKLTIRAALNDANVGLGAFTKVRSVGTTIKTTYFEPRAVFEVAVLTVAETSESEVETVTYIQSAEITGSTG